MTVLVCGTYKTYTLYLCKLCLALASLETKFFDLISLFLIFYSFAFFFNFIFGFTSQDSPRRVTPLYITIPPSTSKLFFF